MNKNSNYRLSEADISALEEWIGQDLKRLLPAPLTEPVLHIVQNWLKIKEVMEFSTSSVGNL